MGEQTKVTGVILAGGLARRMDNQDKGLLLFNGQPLVSYAVSAMSHVADQTIINANRNLDAYRKFGLPVVCDQTATFDGPLAGMLTGMIYSGNSELLVMPCDSPFFKAEHLQKLLTAKRNHQVDIAVAFDGDRLHPVFLTMDTRLRFNLETYLANGHRKVENWIAGQSSVNVDFSNESDVFTNINTLSELYKLEIT